MSMCISTAQACTKRVSRSWLGRRISCKCSRKLSFVTCPCVFRLRRLTQNVRLANFWGAEFFLQILASSGSDDMSMCVSTAQAAQNEASHTNLAKRPLVGSLELVQRSHKEILPRYLLSYRYLVQTSCQETSYRDLCRESCYRGLVHRSCECRGLARKLFLDKLNRDLTLRSLKRSSAEISYRHLVQIALHRDLAQQLLRRTCQEDLAHDLLQRSSQRELSESDLVSLLFTCASSLQPLMLLGPFHLSL